MTNESGNHSGASGSGCVSGDAGSGGMAVGAESKPQPLTTEMLTFRFCIGVMCTRIAAPGSRYCLKCWEAHYRST